MFLPTLDNKGIFAYNDSYINIMKKKELVISMEPLPRSSIFSVLINPPRFARRRLPPLRFCCGTVRRL